MDNQINISPQRHDSNLRPKVVAIDDEPSVLALYEAALETFCDIYLFQNGEEALAFIKSNQIALAIVDRKLPDMSGDELCNCIRDYPRTRNLPIIIISALNEVDDIVEMMPRQRIDTYLTKPITIARLQKHVRSQIDPDRPKTSSFPMQERGTL